MPNEVRELEGNGFYWGNSKQKGLKISLCTILCTDFTSTTVHLGDQWGSGEHYSNMLKQTWIFYSYIRGCTVELHYKNLELNVHFFWNRLYDNIAEKGCAGGLKLWRVKCNGKCLKHMADASDCTLALYPTYFWTNTWVEVNNLETCNVLQLSWVAMACEKPSKMTMIH